MKFTSFKQIIANFLLMSEFVALFFLLCAAIQGSLPLLAALGYAAGSFLATNFLASLLVSTSSPPSICAQSPSKTFRTSGCAVGRGG